MLSSLVTAVTDSFTDVAQNPISITIFAILSLIIISLIIASMSTSWRDVLVRIRLLEEDERPSSLLLWIVGVIIFVKLVQAFVIQPFMVEGGSMLPTFHDQEFLLVDKLSSFMREPLRGEVMVFKLEEGANAFLGKYLIKRVIGLPGERIVIVNGVTTIYNKENPDGFTLDESYVVYKDLMKNVDITLDQHHYFMMGDNRAQSYDSRDWGPLHKSSMRGQAMLRILPIKTFGYEPGRHLYTK